MRVGKIAAILILAVVVASASGAVLGYYVSPASNRSIQTVTQSAIVYSQTMTQTVVAVRTTTQTVTLQNLTDEYELLLMEISYLESVGNLGLSVFAINQTITVPPDTTQIFANSNNGYNGTLEFVSPTGCHSDAPKEDFFDGLQNLTFPLNSVFANLAGSAIQLNSSQFSVSFRNIGSTNVNCTFTLVYVFKGFYPVL